MIYIYDEAGEKQDKFATKPADPASKVGPSIMLSLHAFWNLNLHFRQAGKNYVVKALAWSPDSTK